MFQDHRGKHVNFKELTGFDSLPDLISRKWILPELINSEWKNK